MRRLFARRVPLRWAAPGALLAVLAGGGGAIAALPAHPVAARAVSLYEAAAWLLSPVAGEAELVDGTSAQVVTRVPLGAGQVAGSQSGADGYVAADDGTVRRIDGATYEVSPAARLGRPGQAVGLYPSEGALFVVDRGDGTVTTADPRTLRPRSRVALNATIPAGGAVTDGADGLWAVDATTGLLKHLGPSGPTVVPGPVSPTRTRLVTAAGRAVAVDLAAGRAWPLGADGRDGPGACVDVATGDSSVSVVGSSASPRVYVTSASRGQVFTSDLATGRCGSSVDLGVQGHKFGQPCESADHVFVPDLTTGRVLVVDLTAGRVVADPRVLPAGEPFDLLTRGGVVFFNNPLTQAAGVVALDGTVRTVRKYDPGRAGTAASTPGGPRPSSAGTSAPPAASPQAAAPKPRLRIQISRPQASVGQALAVRAVVTGPPGTVTGVTWLFGDGGSARGTVASHAWNAPGLYPVTVTARFADGTVGTASTTVTVIAQRPPQAALSVTPTTGNAHLAVTASASGSRPGDAPIASYRFDFGDGSAVAPASSSPEATHTYGADGQYTVTVTVTDTAGHSAAASAQVSVRRPTASPAPPPTAAPPSTTAAPATPSAAPTTTTTPQAPPLTAALSLSRTSGDLFLEVTADASRSAGGQGALTYTFDFGDIPGGLPDQGSSATATHVYEAVGTYTVTLTVTDASGASARATETVTATGGTLRLTASATTAVPGQSVTLTASGVTMPSDDLYQYDFGYTRDEGGAGHQYSLAPTHTLELSEPGVYRWKVIAGPFVDILVSNEVVVTVLDPGAADGPAAAPS